MAGQNPTEFEGPASEREETGEVVFYTTEDGRSKLECRFSDESIWMSQALIAELFQTSPQNITIHIKSLYQEGELDEPATCKDYLQVRTEGKRVVRRSVRQYNLDVIIAIGYRVRSPRGTQFRQWATERLREYLVKGFVMDDARLKDPPGPGVPDYFDELLERIRDIRASERRMYLRVRDILALAADYAPAEPVTQAAFQTIQNKLHFAATGKTAPELIASRAAAAKPNMGLTSWKGAIVRKGDVTVAKNYLTEAEITELNRIVVMFLDYAEDQARRRRQIFLADWEARLDDFLRFNERRVLPNAGTVSREDADRLAAEAYDQFSARRRAQREAEGETELIRELEDKAKRLPKRSSKPGGGK
jgi:hypothetical protein